MVRTYNNNNNLSEMTISNRLSADPFAKIKTYLYQDFDLNGSGNLVATHYYVDIDSILTDAQIISALATPIIPAETEALAVFSGSRSQLLAIPDWATWTETQALDWGETNIGTPLATGRATLPVTLTLTTARAAILQIITILDAMWTLQKSLGRMVIALRNKEWPNAQI